MSYKIENENGIHPKRIKNDENFLISLLTCALCDKILNFNAMMCKSCETKFCMDCKNESDRRRGKECVFCLNSENTSVRAPAHVINKLRELQIMCSNCNTFTPYVDIFSHEAKCVHIAKSKLNQNKLRSIMTSKEGRKSHVNLISFEDYQKQEKLVNFQSEIKDLSQTQIDIVFIVEISPQMEKYNDRIHNMIAEIIRDAENYFKYESCLEIFLNVGLIKYEPYKKQIFATQKLIDYSDIEDQFYLEFENGKNLQEPVEKTSTSTLLIQNCLNLFKESENSNKFIFHFFKKYKLKFSVEDDLMLEFREKMINYTIVDFSKKAREGDGSFVGKLSEFQEIDVSRSKK
jgi:hypothetical protein